MRFLHLSPQGRGRRASSDARRVRGLSASPSGVVRPPPPSLRFAPASTPPPPGETTASSFITLSHMHRGADAPRIAEYAQIAFDFGGAAGRLFRIVGEFYCRPAVDGGYLAHDRDRIEIGRTIRRASDKIISEVGAPAETD